MWGFFSSYKLSLTHKGYERTVKRVVYTEGN